MKIFLDTANVGEIKEGVALGVVDAGPLAQAACSSRSRCSGSGSRTRAASARASRSA